MEKYLQTFQAPRRVRNRNLAVLYLHWGAYNDTIPLKSLCALNEGKCFKANKENSRKFYIPKNLKISETPIPFNLLIF
jgi:hypothetical protein